MVKCRGQRLIDVGIVATFKYFSVVNEREEILMLIDEAHRTQGSDMYTRLLFLSSQQISYSIDSLFVINELLKILFFKNQDF
jgi:type I site-specific restriction-modification system R (restriction) subunit